ncbi:MAG: secondary thiamine-phosphate synthase enzyme YjbQ [Eubacterium sp.]|nr:secondary thiamine-phosphate synthase enzyme YjbQ [Eubacterium sp.]
MKILEFDITAPESFMDITEHIRDYVRETRIKNGFIHLQVPEKTCAVTISTNDERNIEKDFLNKVNHFLPKYNGMQFTGWTTTSVKASLVGLTAQILVEGGELILGRHQSVYFVEFNGPAKGRRLYVSHMASDYLAEGEEAALPAELAELYAADQAKEEAEKAEQERIIAEMRAEAAARAAQYKAEQEAQKKAEAEENKEQE